MNTIQLYGDEVEVIKSIEEANEMKMEFYGLYQQYEIYTNGKGKMYAIKNDHRVKIWQV